MPIKDNDIYNPRLKTKQPHPYFNNDANFFHDNDENASSLVCLIPLLLKGHENIVNPILVLKFTI